MATIIEKVWTIDAIETAVRASGSHWFDRSTMRFFGTRVLAPVFHGSGGIFFVTSEKPPHGPRRYSVRQFNPETADIHTHGPFCELSRHRAMKSAQESAAAPPV